MANPIRSDQIESTFWQSRLGELGGIVEDANDINQAITIILTTPKGSDPHRPDFASDVWRHIDKPIPVAAPAVVRDAAAAIAKWEPRCEVTSIEVFQYEGSDRATLRVRVSWKIPGTGFEETLEVVL